MSRSRKPGLIAVGKDLLSYVLGWALIGYEALMVPPKDVNEWFLLLGGSLIGVPGVAEILALRARGTGGETPASSPVPPDSPLPASSPSSTT